MTRRDRTGFTLIEMLVVIAIIVLLVAILLPSMSAARESARAATCGMHLKTFGMAFELYSASDKRGSRTSGAFDHLRDGDVRSFGWVADVINLRIGAPGRMLCPTNRFTINEKVGDYIGASASSSPNPQRPHTVPILPSGPQSREFWAAGYNTNFAATWHFVRGDPTAADGYGVNGDPSDPSKCPGDGDGPLNMKHLASSAVTADRIAVLGDARVGDAAESSVDAGFASAVNDFAGEYVVSPGDFTVESFTDGMAVDFGAVTGTSGEKGHEFNDIAPLHKPKKGDYAGGFANVLFADGHVGAVYDTGGATANEPDGYIGPYKTSGSSFEINDAAFREIQQSIWHGRMRPRASAGGGSNE